MEMASLELMRLIWKEKNKTLKKLNSYVHIRGSFKFSASFWSRYAIPIDNEDWVIFLRNHISSRTCTSGYCFYTASPLSYQQNTSQKHFIFFKTKK